jgi:hypothetical protein
MNVQSSFGSGETCVILLILYYILFLSQQWRQCESLLLCTTNLKFLQSIKMHNYTILSTLTCSRNVFVIARSIQNVKVQVAHVEALLYSGRDCTFPLLFISVVAL